MAKPPPEPYQCDGIAHEWVVVPTGPGEEQVAIALCCGIRAVKKWGEWMLESDLPGTG
jgi:hypothetical protein